MILKEWCKVWKKNNLLFQNLQEFDKHSIFQIYTEICPFCAKDITFDQKKCREVIFDDTEESCKIWRITGLWFGKWHEKFGKFSSEHLKVSKLVLSWIILSKVENAWGKNLQRSYV